MNAEERARALIDSLFTPLELMFSQPPKRASRFEMIAAAIREAEREAYATAAAIAYMEAERLTAPFDCVPAGFSAAKRIGDAIIKLKP